MNIGTVIVLIFLTAAIAFVAGAMVQKKNGLF